MNDSIKLGNLFGIPVRLHWTFLVLVYLLAVLSQEPLFTVGLFAALFVSVLLHELGHALVARRFGIQVVDITFWPLGGMANMTRVPEDSKIEGLVAAAGPAVNLVLAAGSTVFALLATGIGAESAGTALWSLCAVNVVLGCFNLLPIFPMDGGRILRALLARDSDWVTATEGAVRVSRTLILLGLAAALLLPIAGIDILRGSVCILPAIALFLWFAGARELLGVRLRHGRSPFGGAHPGFAPEGWPGGAQDEGPRRPFGDTPRHDEGFSEDFVKELERSHERLRKPPESD